jgi:hypothetical protein
MLLRRLVLRAVGNFFAVDCLPQPQNDPATALREADHLADLFNWADAGPLYAKAAQLFASAGDQRNALYARFGAIRGSMETLNLPETSDYLGNQLQLSTEDFSTHPDQGGANDRRELL